MVGYFWACMGVPSQIEIDCQSADGLQIINKSMIIKVYTLMIVLLILFSSKNWTLTSSSLVNRCFPLLSYFIWLRSVFQETTFWMQQISIVFYNSDNDDNMLSLVYTASPFDISDNWKQWEGEHFGQVSCDLSFFLPSTLRATKRAC